MSIDDFTRAGFVTAATPSYRINSHSYREGGAHLNPRQIVDSIDYAPITLTRGVTVDGSFNKWATGHFDLVQNAAGADIQTSPDVTTGSGPIPLPTNNPGKQYRRTVRIKHVNRVGQTVVEYVLYGAWPVEYKPASNFDADDDEGFSIETIVLAYDGFDVRYTGIAGTAASLVTNTLF